MIGTTLSHYRITEKLGAGGMGEVYRAEDTNLARQVAIKVLPDIFSGDPERLARFEREAKLLASLNHPNIATIHGLEQAEGKRFLVMELAEGETLAQRIAKGPLPLDETLDTCRQIAEGLEAAHEKGVIHRDLKPANIKITPDGKVKILDFGLAKALAVETQSVDSSQSPTITEGMTRPGVILGTAAYMSPEQAKGKAVDKRADIWAFGCILYECLTGKRPFGGEDVSDTLAAILKSDPEWTALPNETPAPIRKLLRRCLQKDRKQRLADIADAQIEIEDAIKVPESELSPKVAAPRKSVNLAWKLATILFAAIALVTLPSAVRHLRETPAEPPALRFDILPPPGVVISEGPVISPDGRWLAFTGQGQSGRSVWIRRLDSAEVRELPDTVSANDLFWSPDSGSIGFSVDGRIKIINLRSGAPETVCDSQAGTVVRAAWGSGDVIIFGGRRGYGLFRVATSGGTPIALTQLSSSDGEIVHSTPSFLPDGRHFLFSISSTKRDRTGVYVGSLDGMVPKRVMDSATRTEYSNGALLFTSGDNLVAQPFDTDQLKATGEPITIAQHPGEWLRFSVSKNWLLACREAWASYQMEWIDRKGKRIGTVGEPSPSIGSFDLSADGSRIVVSRIGPGSDYRNLWVMDAMRSTMFRLTLGSFSDYDPRWSPDGRQIIFDSTRHPTRSPFLIAAGGGVASLVLDWKGAEFAVDAWSPDGKYLLYHDGTGPQLWAVPISGDQTPISVVRVLLGSVDQAEFSPDSKWIAYNSNESGRYEIYVVPFPPTGDKLQITTGGGLQPRWRGDGKELYYLTADGVLMAVDVRLDRKVETGQPHALFRPTRLAAVNSGTEQYAATDDGQRFLFVMLGEQATRSPITILQNWQTAMKK